MLRWLKETLLGRSDRRRIEELRDKLTVRALETQLGFYDNLVDPREALYDDPDFLLPFGQPEVMPVNYDNRKQGEALPVYRTEYGLKVIRDRNRVLCAQNEFAINALSNRVAYTVGRGMQYHVVQRDTDPAKGQGPLAKMAQRVIDSFIRRNAWNEREQDFVRQADIDGDRFLRFFHVGGGNVEVRWIEAEHVKDTSGKPGRAFGVITDPGDVECVYGYSVVDDPDSGTTKDVDADRVIHVKLNTAPTAKRGLPTFYPIRKNLERAERLLKNMSTLAQIQSTFAVIRKHKNFSASAVSTWRQSQADSQVSNPYTGKTQYLRQYPAGSIIDAGDNTDYEFPSANVDASSLVQILQAELRAVASCLLMSETMLTSNTSDGNFASKLVAEDPVVKNFERQQGFYSRRFGDGGYCSGNLCGVLWRVLAMAVEYGSLPREVFTECEIQVDGPSLVVRNKAAETNRAKTLNEKGLLSLRTWAKWETLDYDQEKQLLESEPKPQQTQPPAGPGGDGGLGALLGGPKDSAPPGSAGGDGSESTTESLVMTLELLIEAGASADKKPGEKWQGPSGAWFTKRADGRVVRAADPNKAAGGGKPKSNTKDDGKGGKAGDKSDPAPKPGKGQKVTPDEVKAHIEALKKDPKPELVGKLVEMLRGLTVVQLTALKKELNLKASGAKDELISKLKDRIVANTGDVKPPPKPQPKPRPKPELKPEPGHEPDPKQKKAHWASGKKILADLQAEFERDSMVIPNIPDFTDRMVKAHPELSRKQVHELLKDWAKKDMIVLQIANDPHFEPRSGAKPGSYTVDPEKTEGIIDPDGYLRYYLTMSGDPDAAKKAGLEDDEPASSAPQPHPPEPGFTGYDTLGRKWVNGKLVPGEEEPLKVSTRKHTEPKAPIRLKGLIDQPINDEEYAFLAPYDSPLDRIRMGGDPSYKATDMWGKPAPAYAALVQRGFIKGDKLTLKGVAALLGREMPELATREKLEAPKTPSEIKAWQTLFAAGDEGQRKSILGALGYKGDTAAMAAKSAPHKEAGKIDQFRKELERDAKAGGTNEMQAKIRGSKQAIAVVEALSRMKSGTKEDFKPEIEALDKEYDSVYAEQSQLRSRWSKLRAAEKRRLTELDGLVAKRYERYSDIGKRRENASKEAREAVRVHLSKLISNPLVVPHKADTYDPPTQGNLEAMEGGRKWLAGILDKAGAGDMAPIAVANRGTRAHHRSADHSINMGTDEGERGIGTAIHEMGHAIEHHVPGAYAKCVEFLDHRCGDEEFTNLLDRFGGEFDPRETGRKDHFDLAFPEQSAYYVGKVYHDGTEVLSMGIEKLYEDPVGFTRKDPEFATFIIGMMTNTLGK